MKEGSSSPSSKTRASSPGKSAYESWGSISAVSFKSGAGSKITGSRAPRCFQYESPPESLLQQNYYAGTVNSTPGAAYKGMRVGLRFLRTCVDY